MLDAGFTELNDDFDWTIEANARYVITRNDSSIIAFNTGKDLNTGIRLLGAHTDSPCLRIKPNPEIHKNGYLQLGVEVYGGALLHPWLDRDLSIAGRVSGLDKNGELFHQLIDIKKAIAVIPNLAIHLDRKANDGKTINKQTDLPLIIAQDEERSFKKLLLDYCDSNAERILDYELSCYDTQTPSLVGLNDEFICSARLDNLLSSYIAARAIIDTDTDQASLYVSTDHEEVAQNFVVRSDMGCGSTIGPITATELGIETLDIGVPQWAMHSIRETAGTKDCEYLYASLCAFLGN
ncbi:UNVERIFIED_CONTAM: hypothetical protein GTU68_037214 [Idotea baltica]|nr:hypothetical protein [Idotea baltica]